MTGEGPEEAGDSLMPQSLAKKTDCTRWLGGAVLSHKETNSPAQSRNLDGDLIVGFVYKWRLRALREDATTPTVGRPVHGGKGGN